MEENGLKNKSLFFKKISNLFLIVPLCIAIVLFFISGYYWSPRLGEEPGMCVKRVVGNGTFFITEEVTSSGDIDRVLLNTKDPKYSNLCK